MITCQKLVDFLIDYVAGELPEAQRQAFEEHLALCPPCVVYLQTYLQSVEMARKTLLAEQAEAPPLPEKLVQAILAARCSSGPTPPVA
jgi:anti-sigma factor RsiW